MFFFGKMGRSFRERMEVINRYLECALLADLTKTYEDMIDHRSYTRSSKAGNDFRLEQDLKPAIPVRVVQYSNKFMHGIVLY